MIDLRPCPFCGRTEHLSVRRPMQAAATNYCAVWCDHCHIWGPRGEDAAHYDKRHLSAKARLKLPVIDARQSAADAWNCRALHTPWNRRTGPAS